MKSNLRSILIAALMIVIVPSAQAEDRRLLNEVRRVDRRGEPLKTFDFGTTSGVASQLEFNSVEDLIQDDNSRDNFHSLSRNIYNFQQLNHVLGVREFEDYESTSVAQKLFAYQATVTIGRMLAASPVGAKYQHLLQRLRSLKSSASVSMSRAAHGGLSLNHGEDTSDAFLELSLHASTANGIEPRLSIAKNINLRYDMESHGTLLEYNLDF